MFSWLKWIIFSYMFWLYFTIFVFCKLIVQNVSLSDCFQFKASLSSKTSSPKGNDRSPESNVPRSICPKTLCRLSPTPMMLHIKFDQDWPTGFRDIQVQKCEILVTQGQVTPKWVVWFGPKSNLTKLLCLPWLPATLMMIRTKMNELACRHHFPIISIWEIF